MDTSNMTNEEFADFEDVCHNFQDSSLQDMRNYLAENQVNDFTKSIINYLINSYNFKRKNKLDEDNKEMQKPVCPDFLKKRKGWVGLLG